MSSLNESVSRVRELLNNPAEQKPSIKQIFGSILREYQNFNNTLSNSSQPFTVRELSLVVNSNTDYLITGDAGKILFVTASDNTLTQPFAYPIEFTDLYDASVNWWNYYPVAAARPEDYNYAGFGYKVAFYRKEGSLYARIPQFYMNNTLTITVSTGNWIDGISSEQSAVLTQYHHLPEIRAAMNLCDAARWTDDRTDDRITAKDRFNILQAEEQRVLDDFNIAKRSLVASDVVFIETNDWY